MYSAFVSMYTAKITLLTGIGFAYHKFIIELAKNHQNDVPTLFNNNLEKSR